MAFTLLRAAMSARLFLGPLEIKQLSESELVAALWAVFCYGQFLTFNRSGHGGALSFFCAAFLRPPPFSKSTYR